jgi:hypothetical protein
MTNTEINKKRLYEVFKIIDLRSKSVFSNHLISPERLYEESKRYYPISTKINLLSQEKLNNVKLSVDEYEEIAIIILNKNEEITEKVVKLIKKKEEEAQKNENRF